MWCEVADDSVVVMKSRPVKTGNSLEGKTGTTCRRVGRGWWVPKASSECEGMKFIRSFFESVVMRNAGHKVA